MSNSEKARDIRDINSSIYSELTSIREIIYFSNMSEIHTDVIDAILESMDGHSLENYIVRIRELILNRNKEIASYDSEEITESFMSSLIYSGSIIDGIIDNVLSEIENVHS